MASRRGARSVVLALGLFACGLTAGTAWREGMWGLLAGVGIVTVWIGASIWWMAARPGPSRRPAPEPALPDVAANRLLLDAAPTPMLAIDDDRVRALNRAARRLFATDDRIMPPPAALVEPGADHLRYEGRRWRIDRVTLADTAGSRTVAALVDVEQEERVAEARATAEMIHVLGHELLNGLAPIASLAESGEDALRRPDIDADLLREILGTLARRTDELRRFTEAYRSLARLPEPRCRPVSLVELAGDLKRLFAGRWPQVTLTVTWPAADTWHLDRDQIVQALWALLQNAAEAVVEGGGGEVRLSLDAASAGLTIRVEDDGPGIAADDAQRVFRPFHTTKPAGTGIGLSLARQVAHAHGGTLTLEGRHPTSFRLHVPGQPG